MFKIGKMNRYKLAWTICLFVGIGFMIGAIISAMPIDGYCFSDHECYLINDLGMKQYLRYFGQTTVLTLQFITLAVITLLVGIIPAKLEERID